MLPLIIIFNYPLRGQSNRGISVSGGIIWIGLAAAASRSLDCLQIVTTTFRSN